jgi:hypothetical protein
LINGSGGGNTLPRLNRTIYTKPPGPFSLPAGMFATIGVGIFFDGGGTPLEPTMVAILADAGTNIDGGYVFASIAKGMAAYSVGQTGSPFTKLSKYFKFGAYAPYDYITDESGSVITDETSAGLWAT